MAAMMELDEPASHGRPDKRAPLHLRPMAAEQGLLLRADGSIRFAQGETVVIVSVFGPAETTARDEKIDASTIKVTVVPAAGKSSARELELGEAVRECVEHVVLTQLHPRTAVALTIQVQCDAGSLLATCINASVLALLDAGLPMRTLLGAVDVVVDARGVASVDPVRSEESAAAVRLSFAFAENSDAMVMLKSAGRLAPAALTGELLPIGRAASRAAIAFARLTMERNAVRT